MWCLLPCSLLFGAVFPEPSEAFSLISFEECGIIKAVVLAEIDIESCVIDDNILWTHCDHFRVHLRLRQRLHESYVNAHLIQFESLRRC